MVFLSTKFDTELERMVDDDYDDRVGPIKLIYSLIDSRITEDALQNYVMEEVFCAPLTEDLQR